MFRDLRALPVRLGVLCLLLSGAFAHAGQRLALVLDTSGSMADNDPHRYAVHFAKIMALTLGGDTAVEALYAQGSGCRTGAGAVAAVRFDAAHPGDFDAALEDGVRYLGGNAFGPPLARARTFLDPAAASSTLVVLADANGRSAAERRARYDAEIARRVAAAGGRHEDVDVRVTLMWNTWDDLDLYVTAPSAEVISYLNRSSRCKGVLDVDRNVATLTRQPVENIRWAKGQAPAGVYRIKVQNFGFKEPLHRPVDFVVEVASGGEVQRYPGIIAPRGESGPASDIEVGEFRFDPNRRVDDSNAGGDAVAPAPDDAALNSKQDGCPDAGTDPGSDLAALQGAGASLVSVAVGGDASPFAGLRPMDSSLRIDSAAELTATAAAVASGHFGRDRLHPGAGTGRVEIQVPEYSAQVWLLVTGDGDLAGLHPSRSNPLAGAVDLHLAAGQTRAADGRTSIGYRVIRLVEPAAGTWRFETGSDLPVGWLTESTALPGWPFRPDLPATQRRDTPLLVAGTLAPASGRARSPPATITATAGDLVLSMHDDGRDGDREAGDRVYSALWTPTHSGVVSFAFAAVGGAPLQSAQASVEVVDWALLKAPEVLDFGTLATGEQSATTLDLSASTVHGEVPVALSADLVAASLKLAIDDGGVPRRLTAGKPVNVVLGSGQRAWRLRMTAPRCPPTIADGTAGSVQIRTLSGNGPDQRLSVPLRLSTKPLAWFICLLPLLIIGALFLLAAFIGWGFISPARFPRTLGIVLSPEEDLNEGFFQLIRARKGTGSGFYRDARAYITVDFRLSGRRNGALVGLIAGFPRPRLRLLGQAILRRTPQGEWEPVSDSESVISLGELHRNEAATLFFELRNA